MFLEMEKAKIGMCINSEIRNCEKQLSPEGGRNTREEVLVPDFGAQRKEPYLWYVPEAMPE